MAAKSLQEGFSQLFLCTKDMLIQILTSVRCYCVRKDPLLKRFPPRLCPKQGTGPVGAPPRHGCVSLVPFSLIVNSQLCRHLRKE